MARMLLPLVVVLLSGGPGIHGVHATRVVDLEVSNTTRKKKAKRLSFNVDPQETLWF